MPIDDFSDTVPVEPPRARRSSAASMLLRTLASVLGGLVLFSAVLSALLWLPRGPK